MYSNGEVWKENSEFIERRTDGGCCKREIEVLKHGKKGCCGAKVKVTEDAEKLNPEIGNGTTEEPEQEKNFQ